MTCTFSPALVAKHVPKGGKKLLSVDTDNEPVYERLYSARGRAQVPPPSPVPGLYIVPPSPASPVPAVTLILHFHLTFSPKPVLLVKAREAFVDPECTFQPHFKSKSVSTSPRRRDNPEESRVDAMYKIAKQRQARTDDTLSLGFALF